MEPKSSVQWPASTNPKANDLQGKLQQATGVGPWTISVNADELKAALGSSHPMASKVTDWPFNYLQKVVDAVGQLLKADAKAKTLLINGASSKVVAFKIGNFSHSFDHVRTGAKKPTQLMVRDGALVLTVEPADWGKAVAECAQDVPWAIYGVSMPESARSSLTAANTTLQKGLADMRSATGVDWTFECNFDDVWRLATTDARRDFLQDRLGEICYRILQMDSLAGNLKSACSVLAQRDAITRACYKRKVRLVLGEGGVQPTYNSLGIVDGVLTIFAHPFSFPCNEKEIGSNIMAAVAAAPPPPQGSIPASAPSSNRYAEIATGIQKALGAKDKWTATVNESEIVGELGGPSSPAAARVTDWAVAYLDSLLTRLKNAIKNPDTPMIKAQFQKVISTRTVGLRLEQHKTYGSEFFNYGEGDKNTRIRIESGALWLVVNPEKFGEECDDAGWDLVERVEGMIIPPGWKNSIPSQSGTLHEGLKALQEVTGQEWTFECNWEQVWAEATIEGRKNWLKDRLGDSVFRYITEGLVPVVRNMCQDLTQQDTLLEACHKRIIRFVLEETSTPWGDQIQTQKVEDGVLILSARPRSFPANNMLCGEYLSKALANAF